MPKNKKKKMTLEELYEGSDYIIDDSKMPSAEEMKNFEIPPELQQEALESALEIAREFMRERGEKVTF
ncbi:hypothetical protein [Holdemanella biformis]|jgi:hypothetical protein